jgi:hypothetical protein
LAVVSPQRSTAYAQLKRTFIDHRMQPNTPGQFWVNGSDVRRPAWPQQIDDDDPGPE